MCQCCFLLSRFLCAILPGIPFLPTINIFFGCKTGVCLSTITTIYLHEMGFSVSKQSQKTDLDFRRLFRNLDFVFFFAILDGSRFLECKMNLDLVVILQCKMDQDFFGLF